MARRVHILLPTPYYGVGSSTAAIEIANGFRRTSLDPILYLARAAEPLPEGLARVLPLPFDLRRIARLPLVRAFLRRRIEARLLKAVRREGRNTLVWLWPDASTRVIRGLRALGAILVREMINTHRGTAKRILDAESARLGLPPQHRISEASIRIEQAELEMMDYVVSPSRAVDESLAEWGIPAERVIRSTFGWDPAKLSTQPIALPGEGVRALFVGSVGIRKGIHLALAAWRKANVGGTFVIFGKIDADVQPLIDPYLEGNDVAWLPFTRDLGGVYRGADFLLFPTLEEGAPLVCYEAGGCGLPILTSPMGQARIVEHEINGLVVDPFDEAALVGAIRRLSEIGGRSAEARGGDHLAERGGRALPPDRRASGLSVAANLSMKGER